MMRTALFAAAVSAVAAGNALDREVYERAFFEHMNKFQLSFKSGEEFVQRLQVFSDNFDMIQKHNSENHSYTLGLNQFSHMTLDEFHDYVHLGGTRPPNLRRGGANQLHTAPADMSTVPDSIDHTTLGAVAAIKNQGSCGSCWAFSATSALESARYYKHGELVTYAEQQLVSCDKVDGGCNGGWMDDAFTFVQQNGGLTTPDQYPYTSGASGATGTCKTAGITNDAKVAPTGFTDVQAGSVDALKSAVAKQPVSIAIQANQLAFQSYKSGVLTGKCGQRLDHGVVAVGYGTLDGIDYWKVRNSWGDSWGIDGYVLIERSSKDLCGVLDAASYPNL